MKNIYFTIAGTRHHYGSEFMERGMEVYLKKDPDNDYDKEAIKVTLPGLGLIGWVANSVNTVLGESMSAGRMYDKVGNRARGKVLYILPHGVICELTEPDTGDESEEDDDDTDTSDNDDIIVF